MLQMFLIGQEKYGEYSLIGIVQTELPLKKIFVNIFHEASVTFYFLNKDADIVHNIYSF